MKKCKAAIVDDEPPARDVIAEYLEDVDWIKIMQSFGKPRKSLDYLNKNKVDLLFLDIQMPQMTGFELVQQLDNLPQIIFSTAYDKYAIRAFDINAVDYLLKPYTKERLMDALRRVKSYADEDNNQQKRIRALLKQVQQKTEYPRKLFVRSHNQIIPVEVDDIYWIKAEGDYSTIYFKNDKVFCGTGLGKLLEQLDQNKFARIHRSHAVSFSALNNLEPDGYGGFIATLDNGTEIKVSRTYSDQIKDFIV